MANLTKNKRALTITGGIFLVLLSITLCVNYGYVIRAISFPFTYLLGAASYLVYFFFWIHGVSYVFTGHHFKLKKKWFLLPLILILFGLSMLLTSTFEWTKPIGFDFLERLNSAIGSIEGGYWNAKFINFFTSKIYGGLIGYCLVGPLNGSIGQVATLAISITILSIGVISFAIPLCFKIHKSYRKKHPYVEKPKKLKEPKEKPITEDDKNVDIEFENKAVLEEKREEIPFVESNDSIKNARRLDDLNNTHDERYSDIESLNFEKRFDKNESSLTFDRDISDVGSFSPAKFVLSGADENCSLPKALPAEHIETFSNKPEQKEEKLCEQEQLDFDAKPEFNEELLSKEPIFETPIETINNSINNEQTSVQVEKNNILSKTEPIENIDLLKKNETPIEEKPKPKIPWVSPSSDLLNVYETQEADSQNEEVANERLLLINQLFDDFRINAVCTGFTIGPSITRFHIDYKATGQVRSVQNMTQDLSRRLSGVSVIFEPQVPGFTYSGLQVPNAVCSIVSFKEVYDAVPKDPRKPLLVPFGKDITGNVRCADFHEFPHLLVSGTSGSGKSVFVNSLLTTLIMRNSPDDLKLVLVDPKRVEMSKYKEIPHLMCPVITEAKRACLALNKLQMEMERRYDLLEQYGYSDLKDYNEDAADNGLKKVPYIVCVLDEFCDLAHSCKDILGPLTVLTAKARACGIHLLVATQRPSTDVIDGTIKSNLNTRVSLSAASSTDSVTVLDEGGAQDLLGNGDMLVKSPLISRSGLTRLQGCLVKNKEIINVVGYIKERYPTEYDPDFMNMDEVATQNANDLISSGEYAREENDADEAKYQSIKSWVMTHEIMSMSKIQRECGVGFSRAGKIFKRLQQEGVVEMETDNPARGNKVIQSADRFYSDDSSVGSDELTTRGDDF